jgi:uncharacterized membrane-anchored protein
MNVRFYKLMATLCAVAVLFPSWVRAETLEEFEAKLPFKSGVINIGNGLATLNLSNEFRYIDPNAAEMVLVKVWGNPPASAKGNLGMIFPNDGKPAVASWGAIISYEEDGYVDDQGAEKINYDNMATEIRESLNAVNPDRIKQGYEPLTFVGWAEHPHYDKGAHKLYWAKEIRFGDSPENTLNYNIRILGRKGVLVLNAIASKSQLQEVSQKTAQLLPMIDFNPGNRYTDFVPGTDKVAEYGIAAIVAGTVAAKAGLFKWLIALLVAGKKFIIIGVFAVFAVVRKMFGRKGAATTTKTESQ